MDALGLTVVIANHCRPNNIDRIAANLPPCVKLFLVDNACGSPGLGEIALARADWVLTSTRNNLTTRWFMAAQAETAYYCVHDDDLLLKPDLYQRYVDYMENSEDLLDRVLTGPFGVRRIEGKSYAESHHTGQHGDGVDIIKGRMMFGQVAYLSKIPTCPRGIDGVGFPTVISEDIYVSAILARKYGGLFRVTNFGGIIELPAPFASSASPIHFQRRELACQHLFGPSLAGDRVDGGDL